MVRLVVIAALALAVPVGARAMTAAEAAQILQQVADAAEKNDAKTAQAGVDKLLADPEFAALPDPARLYTHTLATALAIEAKDNARASKHAMAGTAIDEAPAQLWHWRYGLQLQDAAQTEAAVTTLEAMAQRAPAALAAMRVRSIYALNRRFLSQPNPALRRRMLEVVGAPGYQPDEVGASGEFFRAELAAMRSASGDMAGARALVATLTEGAILIEVSVDKRLRDFLPADFDLRAVVERNLAKRRDVAASHPGSLYAVIDIVRALRTLGRYQEAVATLEAARPDGTGAKSFTDLDEQRNWWWDQYAYATAKLGKFDDAIAAFKRGMVSEDGGANVSQTINLAAFQLRLGRDKDALATLVPLGEGKGASPYGVMQIMGVRGCARHRTGDIAGAAADRAWAEKNRREAETTYVLLLQCRGEADAAAAATIALLDDPDKRTGALIGLSDFDPPPAGYPEDPGDALSDRIRERPDVRAAIARAGGTRRFNVAMIPQ